LLELELDENDPRGHVVHNDERAAENDPAGHAEHVADPVDDENPATHDTQTFDVLAPSKFDAVPAGHCKHELEPWPATGLNLPAGHGEQSSARIDAMASKKKPAGHCVQALEPETLENEPRPHA
jgi:hypothetical protein